MKFLRNVMSIFSRLRYLEQRESELTAAVMRLDADIAHVADIRLEMQQLLPAMRKTLAAPDQSTRYN